MKSQSVDTPLAVERILIEGYRKMSPAEKMRRVVEMNRGLDELAMAGIRARHGSDLTEREVKLGIASLHLDVDTMRRVFDWNPDEQGF